MLYRKLQTKMRQQIVGFRNGVHSGGGYLSHCTASVLHLKWKYQRVDRL